MAKKIMTRSAADNKYLHRDFHVSMDLGLAYIGKQYGDEAVKLYLRRYTLSYLSSLCEEIKSRGLVALSDYLHRLYAIEEAEDVLTTALSDAELTVRISRCPAVTFMRSAGHEVSPWYRETVATVYQTLAKCAGIGFELLSYDIADGKSEFCFFLV